MKQILFVFLGGGVGSISRYLISKWLNTGSSTFPYGTFAVNVIGSLIIGLILGYTLKNTTISQHMTLLLATGFCGGFTTFSTFAYENQIFLKNGDLLQFGLYTFGSLALAIMAVFLGLWIMKSV